MLDYVRTSIRVQDDRRLLGENGSDRSLDAQPSFRRGLAYYRRSPNDWDVAVFMLQLPAEVQHRAITIQKTDCAIDVRKQAREVARPSLVDVRNETRTRNDCYVNITDTRYRIAK